MHVNFSRNEYGVSWQTTLSIPQKISATIAVFGILLLLLSLFHPMSFLWLIVSLSSIIIGTIYYAIDLYHNKPAGIHNNGLWFRSLTSTGIVAYCLGIFITLFYIVLYFFPAYLGLGVVENSGLIQFFDPLKQFLQGNSEAKASQWFVYGVLYTIAILIFGIKFLLKYKHNKYHQYRTISVMFFQLSFAFFIPEIMARLHEDLPYYDIKNIWPLNYYLFEQWSVDSFLSSGTIGTILLLFGIASIFIISPILTYLYGKRWYCSWVCGCGGLAETAGDSFRHLSDKSLFAWKVERYVIYPVLLFVTLMTMAVIHSYLQSGNYLLSADAFLYGTALFLILVFASIWIWRRNELQKDAKIGALLALIIILSLIALHKIFGTQLLLFDTYQVKKVYGFLIGAVFSGVIGVGFYPILGNRVWCRFGCPMAAVLGIQQKLFSRFKITTNGDQCISCGNCSTYCEMGIDVRAYAQNQQDIKRASCVGCGICAAVCPRGVLKLENGTISL